MTLSTTSVDSRPFSIRSDSSARTRWTTQGSGSVWWLPMSGLRRVEIALPEIDVHALLRLRGVSPQLPRLEAHAVERLGAASAPVRVRVRQNVNPVESVDAPAVPARVAGQGSIRVPLEVFRPRVELVPADHPLFDHQRLDRDEPVLVVARVEIARLPHALDGVAKLVDGVDALDHADEVHHEHGFLPIRVEGRLVRLPLDGPEAVIAAEVVDAVHGGCARMIPRGAGTVKQACVPR